MTSYDAKIHELEQIIVRLNARTVELEKVGYCQWRYTLALEARLVPNLSAEQIAVADQLIVHRKQALFAMLRLTGGVK